MMKSTNIIVDTTSLMFQDHKYKARLDGESQGQILVAKEQGNLHETLLDRREKIKSDRMCK